MTERRLSDWNRVRVRALLIGDRLDLRTVQKTERRVETPLVVAAGERGFAVLFRYAATVMFNVQPAEEVAFLSDLRTALEKPHERPESEETEIRVDPDGSDRIDPSGVVRLKKVTKDKGQAWINWLLCLIVIQPNSLAKKFCIVMIDQARQLAYIEKRCAPMLYRITAAIITFYGIFYPNFF